MNWGEILTIVLSLTTIIGCSIGWAWSRLDKKFEKIDQRFERIDQRFERIDQRFDKLFDEMKEIRMAISRLEGAVYSKDCCMLKDEKITKKAK